MPNNWTIKDKNFEKFIDSNLIEERVKATAHIMNEELKGKNPLFIVILNGSFIFASDIFKKITIDCEITFIKLSSYRGTASTGCIEELMGLDKNIDGRTIVVVEDIVDTGLTLQSFLDSIKQKNPAEIKIARCFVKPDVFQNKFPIDYKCFDIPNDFVVGYGLDYDGYGRNSEHLYKLCQ